MVHWYVPLKLKEWAVPEASLRSTLSQTFLIEIINVELWLRSSKDVSKPFVLSWSNIFLQSSFVLLSFFFFDAVWPVTIQRILSHLRNFLLRICFLCEDFWSTKDEFASIEGLNIIFLWKYNLNLYKIQPVNCSMKARHCIKHTWPNSGPWTFCYHSYFLLISI